MFLIRNFNDLSDEKEKLFCRLINELNFDLTELKIKYPKLEGDKVLYYYFGKSYDIESCVKAFKTLLYTDNYFHVILARSFNPWSSVLAANAQGEGIKFYPKFFKMNFEFQYGVIPHEFTHKLGLNHDFRKTPRRAYSPSYQVGYFMEYLNKELVPSPEGFWEFVKARA